MRVNRFANGMSLKVNIMARLVFELAYLEVTVQYVSHYTTGTPSLNSNLLNFTLKNFTLFHTLLGIYIYIYIYSSNPSLCFTSF